MTQKNINFMFFCAGCSLLRAEGFMYGSLDVFYGGLGIKNPYFDFNNDYGREERYREPNKLQSDKTFFLYKNLSYLPEKVEIDAPDNKRKWFPQRW